MGLPAAPPLRLLVETPRFLCVEKPAGLAHHESGEELGVLQVARAQQQAGQLGSYDGRLHGVHRLDRVTSGLLLLAKTSADAGLLGAAFRSGSVVKFYAALSDRRPSRKMGTVAGDMAPARRGAFKLLREQERPAVTRFVSSGVAGSRPGLRGFVLRPLTGRTHQLRVALKSLGSPVLGDALYADATSSALEERSYLHACAIALPPLAPGDDAFSLVCPPRDGAEFAAAGFQAWFAERFPTHVPASWCAGSPLLTAVPPGQLWEDIEEY